MPRWFKKYVLPGLVFQSVVIAGGYGTGREIVEFFLMKGPGNGLLAMLVSMVIFSVVTMATYEFARVFRTFDYRHFFQELLGPLWVVFEICFIILIAIIGAVIGAAAGSILQETFGLPFAVGVVGIMAAVAFLVFKGSATIERVLAAWSFVLYGVYVVLFGWAFAKFGPAIRDTLAGSTVEEGWFLDGVAYAGYNVVVATMALFVVRHLESRRDAVIAGALTGPIAMIPAALLYVAMLGVHPGVLDRPVPVNYLLEMLGSPGFQIIFQIMLFGTLIESGAGLIHALNERIDGLARERGGNLPDWTRAAIAVVFLVVASSLAPLGLMDLIARGYGTLTWAFIALYVVPIVTWGVVRIRKKERDRSPLTSRPPPP